MTGARAPLPERALILAPVARDATLARALLAAGTHSAARRDQHRSPGMIAEETGLVILA